MMGERLVMQDSLFYEFRLEEHVPTDHRLRTIDRFVDLSDLQRHLASFQSAIGRPSIDFRNGSNELPCLASGRGPLGTPKAKRRSVSPATTYGVRHLGT